MLLKWDDRRVWVGIALLLCLPAFLINLGIVPFIGDEGIRSIVALEMMLSGQYIVPSINGDFYFAKPPLYNWILIGFFKLFGSVDEWTSRIPTVFFSFVFLGTIIYYFRDKYEDRFHSVWLGLLFITCGRMIFWDSFLGLIDIFFSWVMFLMIMVLYEYGHRSKFSVLYPLSYFLAAVGFMLKGFPILHFLIFGLLVVHFMWGQWRMLLSRHHLLGILIFGVLIGSYFFLYNESRELDPAVDHLLDQSTRRTIARHGLLDVFLHFLSYPFENLYHFLPWSILGLFAIRRDILQRLRSHSFFWYLTLSFVANHFVYWVSPDVYPRYILMLIPIIFGIWVYLYEGDLGKNTWQMRVLSKVFMAMMVGVPIISFTQIFNSKLNLVEHHELKLALLGSTLFGLAVIYYKKNHLRPILLIICVLMCRIGFNMFILPVRANTGDDVIYKSDAQRVGQQYKEHSLELLRKTRINFVSSFYLVERRRIPLRRHHGDPIPGRLYIVDSLHFDSKYQVLDTLKDSEFGGTRWVIATKDSVGKR